MVFTSSLDESMRTKCCSIVSVVLNINDRAFTYRNVYIYIYIYIFFLKKTTIGHIKKINLFPFG